MQRSPCFFGSVFLHVFPFANLSFVAGFSAVMCEDKNSLLPCPNSRGEAQGPAHSRSPLKALSLPYPENPSNSSKATRSSWTHLSHMHSAPLQADSVHLRVLSHLGSQHWCNAEWTPRGWSWSSVSCVLPRPCPVILRA